MRRLLAVCTVLISTLYATSLRAQAPAISPTMRGPTSYVQLQIISGKLNLLPKQAVRTRSSSSSSSNNRQERMTVDLTGTHPSIDYTLNTQQWQLVIQARNQTQFRIAREVREAGSAAPFEFKQNETGDLAFTWGDGESQRQRRFSTLWHLLLVEPEAAKTHLLPLLEFFRPGWNLATSQDRICDALYANVDDRQGLPRERWTRLLAQLSDNRYANREAADRQLRAEGKAVLSFLEALDADKLDFEQRHRIRGIRKSLTRGDDNDAPESIAAWLAGDPRVWLALLNHADLSRRQIAARQLSRLLGEQITFDPASSPETRLQQIEAIRQKLEVPAIPEAKAS